MTDILIVGVDNDLGVSGWVCPIFVRPRVQGCHVDVLDLFSKSSLCLVMQFDGIGATPEEGVSGLKWFDEFEGVEEVLSKCSTKGALSSSSSRSNPSSSRCEM